MLNSISGMRITILVFLLATNQHHASEATSLTAVAKFEQCQANNLGHVFLVGKDVSLRKCAAHCSKKEWCKGLAFARNVILCSLYNSMTSWGQTQSTQGDCAVIYKGNLTGMDFADVQLEELMECNEFVTVANGTVLGNMNREGNRKQVVCNDGFEIQNGSDISRCQNGKWEPKPTCVPKCGNGWQKHGSTCYFLVRITTSADGANKMPKVV
ncbi:hypothetical protein DPMN_094703 [Dreissena polymorpha]|uniref:Sushi domain-containing protein n=1 Tax=Dreissena polymorpha TaxID=45954 RepID=A0A9D4L567_DREPO|nr:hypothetical protein DPMN_094703 [Dreissena polymorpha]